MEKCLTLEIVVFSKTVLQWKFQTLFLLNRKICVNGSGFGLHVSFVIQDLFIKVHCSILSLSNN